MSNLIPSTPRRHSQSETDTDTSSRVSTASSSGQSSASEDDSEKSAQTPVMKTRPTRDTAQEMPATQSTNSSAPSPATMTSSSPSVKNRQTGDQKRARYGQARDLLAYQRHAQINKLNTVKKAQKAEKARKTEKTDIPRTTTPDNRWDRFTNAVNPSGLFILRRANELSELVAWLSTSPTSLR
jgi:hypothetical protein